MLPSSSRPWQVLLVLAALDSAATGAYSILLPGSVFALLQCPPNDDALLLCRVLGFLVLTHVPCLLLAAFRAGCAGLTLLPLFGRLLSSGLWLWLLGSGRLPAAEGALLTLLAHDVVWPPLLAAFLATRRPLTTGALPRTAPPVRPD